MATIPANLQAVKDRVRAAAESSGRSADTVRLLAVSKTWSADCVREAAIAGQRAFAENYLQEALPKIAALGDLGLEWHFIGPVQSNKTREIAAHFDWLHSLDRLKIAERLSAQRPADLPPLQVCLQVNVSGEASKSGVAPSEVAGLARAVAGLPRLRLRGLMTIPEPGHDAAVLRSRFARLRELLHELGKTGMALDTLSMGMSDDFELAIGEGATLIRVGTAIFGARTKPAAPC